MKIKCVSSRARQTSFSQPTHITKRQHTLKSAEGRTASAAARAAAECRRGRRRGWQWTGQQQGRWHKSGGEGGAGEPLSTRLFLRSATSTVRRAREASTVRRARGRRRRGRRRGWRSCSAADVSKSVDEDPLAEVAEEEVRPRVQARACARTDAPTRSELASASAP